MKKLVILIMAIYFYISIFITVSASIPASPKTIAGIDNISIANMTKALISFCKLNECSVSYDDEFGPIWTFYNKNRDQVGVIGSDCAGIPHHYCLQIYYSTHYYRDVEFWYSITESRVKYRLYILKTTLSHASAQVTLMNCSVESTDHGFDYVCANGKPPP